MSRGKLGGFALVLALAATLVAAGAAQASSIFFIRSGQIWVANPDLSGATKLTHGHYDSGWPVWSPDGKRIAFDSGRTDHTPNNSSHVNDIFTMNADGTGLTQLTHCPPPSCLLSLPIS